VVLKVTTQLVNFIRLVTNNFNKLILEQNDPFRKNTKSTIISKEFLGRSQNSYRGLVRISPNANARNFSQCDSLLMEITAAHILFHISKVKSTAK
jgi:Fe-S cluster assembly protein SufB